MSSRAGAWLSAAATTGLVGYLYWPALACPTRCIVDPVALRGSALGNLELPDVDLNAWILAWVQHALLTHPSGLFDANVFHPARAVLTQSEHMLAIALWLLPLRLLSDSAVWLHQAAVIGSSWMLALTTGALVRWLTASSLAGFAAGAAALWMPWRFTELAHVQLLNAQWFPLVWLLAARVAEAPERRPTAVALAVVLGLQMLSSFYLSYFLLLSCAGLLLGIFWVLRPGVRAFRRLALAAVLPLAALVATALPYLWWRREYGFHSVDPLFDSVPPADVLALTLPQVPTGLRHLPLETSFAVPLAVALLAAVSLAALRRDEGRRPRRQRAFVSGLLLACGGALLLCLGRRLELGDASLPLPGSLAAALVPGFANLRNPLRFAIVIGVAAPVLAGVGLARLLSLARTPRRRAVTGTLALALLSLNLVTPPLPARDAWAEIGPSRAIDRALASLPRGALLEIPWPLQPEHDAIYAGRAMLESTLHWQPLLNGHSGYEPPSYPLLRQVGQDLPSAQGLARLQQLVDLRWILVNGRDLAPDERAAWREAEREGRLRAVLAAGASRLYEVVDREGAGAYTAALVSPRAGKPTLAGRSRAPLSPAEATGTLGLEVTEAFHFAGHRRLPRLVTLRIGNRGSRTWPGLDPDPEGLVRLRYAFVAADGTRPVEESSALAADVPPGVTAIRVPIAPPASPGPFRLRADLVQRVHGEDHPLPIEPVELPVQVSALAP